MDREKSVTLLPCTCHSGCTRARPRAHPQTHNNPHVSLITFSLSHRAAVDMQLHLRGRIFPPKFDFTVIRFLGNCLGPTTMFSHPVCPVEEGGRWSGSGRELATRGRGTWGGQLEQQHQEEKWRRNAAFTSTTSCEIKWYYKTRLVSMLISTETSPIQRQSYWYFFICFSQTQFVFECLQLKSIFLT